MRDLGDGDRVSPLRRVPRSRRTSWLYAEQPRLDRARFPQPGGPPGYLYITTRPHCADPTLDPWSETHLREYHGWSPQEIEAHAHTDRHGDDHWLRESDGTRLDLAIPHVHFFGVEYAIAHSGLRRELKSLLFELLENLRE